MEDLNIKNNLETYMAAELFIKSGRGSISYLQMKMCYGYHKAKLYVEELCKEGILTKIEEDDVIKYKVNIKDLNEFHNKYVQPKE